jgi:acetate kinase
VLDDGCNARHSGIISAADSGIVVRVVRTDEDVMIARHTTKIIQGLKATSSMNK